MAYKKWTSSSEQLAPDARFNSKLVSKFINCFMLGGRKSAAQKMFYGAMNEIAQKVKESQDVNFGYNALTHEYGDLVKMGVIVPTKVERTALQNAASIASLLLTTDAVVSEIKEDKPEPAGAGAGGGMY